MEIDINKERAVINAFLKTLPIPHMLKVRYSDAIYRSLTFLEEDRLGTLNELEGLCIQMGISYGIPVRNLINKIKKYSFESPIDEGDNLCDIAILSAMKSPELNEFLRLMIMDNNEGKKLFENRFSYKLYSGTLSNTISEKKVSVIAVHQNRMGLVDAASMAMNIIYLFNPKYIVMIGVCGGRDSEGVKVGDIIIPRTIFTYQSGKYSDDGWNPEPMNEDIDANLISRIQSHADDISINIMKRWAGSTKRIPQVWFDCMACGDAVINRKGMMEDQIASIQRKVVAVDMESYGLVRASKLATVGNTVPLIIKGVMDLTESKTDKDKKFASFVSANFLYELAFLELI